MTVRPRKPRCRLSRVDAYVGVLTGMLAIVSVVGPFFSGPLGAPAVPRSVFTTAWVLISG